jgi:D-tyrosyl-tRNA(Tyr) deacylase
MRVVVQRVAGASVTVGGREAGRIGKGFLVLAGFRKGDGDEQVRWMARKVASLRVFGDEAERMSLALDAVQGSVLVVSQFTLYGDVRKGRRPSFTEAMEPERANQLFQRFCEACRKGGVNPATGRFRAEMLVEIANDGPVTILLDTERAF